MATISVLYGSVRSNRNGIRAARFIESQLKSRGHNTHLLDPKEVDLPILDKMFKEYDDGEAPQNMQKVSDKLKESDGFIIVSGEYNHSYPPALKNLLDHFQKEYFFKPSGLVTYSTGSFGGVRAGVQLRAIVSELGMPSISSMMPIPNVLKAFDEEGNALDEKYLKRSEKFFKEFEWYLEALKSQRSKGTPF